MKNEDLKSIIETALTQQVVLLNKGSLSNADIARIKETVQILLSVKASLA